MCVCLNVVYLAVSCACGTSIVLVTPVPMTRSATTHSLLIAPPVGRPEQPTSSTSRRRARGHRPRRATSSRSRPSRRPRLLRRRRSKSRCKCLCSRSHSACAVASARAAAALGHHDGALSDPHTSHAARHQLPAPLGPSGPIRACAPCAQRKRTWLVRTSADNQVGRIVLVSLFTL